MRRAAKAAVWSLIAFVGAAIGWGIADRWARESRWWDQAGDHDEYPNYTDSRWP